MNMRKSNEGGAIRLSESKLKAIIAESVNGVLREYNQDTEDWWRHNGVYDREQASGIRYKREDGDLSGYLSMTDDWWESLTDKQKETIYQTFFEEI